MRKIFRLVVVTQSQWNFSSTSDSVKYFYPSFVSMRTYACKSVQMKHYTSFAEESLDVQIDPLDTLETW